MLTGEIRYRVTRWRQRIVIQVAEWILQFNGYGPSAYARHWRDATIRDILKINAGDVEPNQPSAYPPPPKPPQRRP